MPRGDPGLERQVELAHPPALAPVAKHRTHGIPVHEPQGSHAIVSTGAACGAGSRRVIARTATRIAASAPRLSWKAEEIPECSAPKKITPITATPTALPTFCRVVITPEAAPPCSGAAE